MDRYYHCQRVEVYGVLHGGVSGGSQGISKFVRAASIGGATGQEIPLSPFPC